MRHVSILLTFGFLLLVAAVAVSGCSSNDCITDSDCPNGRVCRVGLCSLGIVGADGTGLEDVTLDCSPPAPGELVINEILADPPAGIDIDGNGAASSSGDEFVEIVNLSTRPVALTTVEIGVNDKRVSLGARCLNPFEARVFFGSNGLPSLSNSGATVRLFIAGQEVQTHTYGSEGGRDSSLVLTTELEADGGWVVHNTAHATAFSPGTCGNGNTFPNCAGGGPIEPGECDAATAADLVMNEILADPPAGDDVDGNGTASATGDEFVEVVNIGSKPVALNNVEIHVNDRKIALGNQCLGAMQARVIFGSQGLPGLANTGATVALKIGAETIQSHTYGAEGGRDASLVLAQELNAASGWAVHNTVHASRRSPGTCGNGNAFPDCSGGVVNPDAVGDATIGDASIADGGPVANCSLRPMAGDLVINEILADPGAEGSPTGNDANQDGQVSPEEDEFVEIINNSGETLLVSGVEVRDAGGRGAVIPAGVCLEPQQALLVFGRYRGGGDFGGALAFGGTGSLSLNNTGDTVRILGSEGEVLTEVSYDSNANFDQSLTRAIDTDPTSAFVRHTQAEASEGRRMSPGRCKTGAAFPDCGFVAAETVADTVSDVSGPMDATAEVDPGPDCAAPIQGELLIHEIVRAPGGNDFNGDGTADNKQDEYVEIANPTAAPLNLGGLELWDAISRRHVFAPFCLQPGEVIVVFGGGAPIAGPPGATFIKASTGDLALNDTQSETVEIRTSGGTVLETLTTAQTSFAGKAWTRSPDCTRFPVVEHPQLNTLRASPGLRSDGQAFSVATCQYPG